MKNESIGTIRRDNIPKLTPIMDMTNPIPFFSNSLSPRANSVTAVRAISMVPSPTPIKNRKNSAIGSDVAIPKATEKTDPLTKLMMSTNRLPYRSAIFPQGYELNARPTMNELAIIPA